MRCVSYPFSVKIRRTLIVDFCWKIKKYRTRRFLKCVYNIRLPSLPNSPTLEKFRSIWAYDIARCCCNVQQSANRTNFENFVQDVKMCDIEECTRWPTWQVLKIEKERARWREQKRKEPENRTTIDMKIRTVPNVTSATRCYAIPLGENAKPFQNGMTGSPKTYKQ